MWPASTSRWASVSPERSSCSCRVSDTVSTAIRTGLNGSCSSIGTCYGPHRVDTDRGLAGKARKTRPHALRQRIQAFGVRAIPLLIHPVVPQHHLHIMARLHEGDRFDEQQRVVRSEEHTSELQSQMRTSYAVF